MERCMVLGQRPHVLYELELELELTRVRAGSDLYGEVFLGQGSHVLYELYV